MDNNIVSVKVGNKVFSWDTSNYSWTDVTATYPYIRGTIQTEFDIYPGPSSQVLETGGYFIYHDMIYALAKLSGIAPDPDFIEAVPFYPVDYSSEPQLPIYLDAYENGSTLYSDDTWEHKLTEIPQNGDSFYIIESGNLVLVSNAVIYPTATAGSTATDVPPVTPVHEWQRYRNGTLLPFKPVTLTNGADGKPLAYDTTSDSIKPTNELTVENLTVTDTATIAKSIVQETEQVTSTEDTIVLRENAVTPIPSRGSGIVINNYDGNGTPLGILADSDGTVRVGAEGGTSVTYPVLWQVGSNYYNAGEQDMDTTASVTPQGVFTDADESYESADSVVYYNGSYYFKYIDWYVNPKIWLFGGNTVSISNGPPAQLVTDEDLIATLETLTPVKVHYYVNAVFTTVGDKQPLATREEATVLNNNDILVWDSTANQLKHITRPTVNGTALKAILTNGVVTGYDWGSSGGNGVAFIGTRAAYNTAKLIPEGQDGYIPAGAIVVITDEDELIIGDEVQ